MDSFENIIASIMEKDGFWTKTEFKVDLTKEEKREMGRPSSPRWELDVLAYKASTNEVLVIECKSYLDSTGVGSDAFINPESKDATRYKLFTEANTRAVVFGRLSKQLVASGLSIKRPKLKLCLAVGKVKNEKSLTELETHFKKNNWLLMSPSWIKDRLEEMSEGGYENSVAAVTAKLLLRQ